MILENFYLIISTFLLVLAFHSDKDNSLFTPIKLFVYASFIYLLLPGFYLINFAQQGAFWNLDSDSIIYENVGILLFISMFLFAFAIIQRVKLPQLNKNFNSNVKFLVILLLLVSLYAKYYIFTAGAFFLEDKYNDAINSIPRHILFMNNIHLWGYIIWFVYFFRITEGRIFRNNLFFYKIISLLYFLVTIGIPIIQGRRFGVIFPLLMLMGLYSFYHKLNFRKLVKYGVLVFSTFILITVLRFSQSVLLSNNQNSDILNVIESVDSSVMKNLFDGTVGRIGNVYIVFNRIIEFKSSNGLTPSFNSFILSFQGLVPSFLWIDKPNLSIGNTLGKELGLLTWGNELTGINAGWIGEGYYNDNFRGVALAAILYAITIAILFKIASLQYDTGKLVFLMSFTFIISGFQMEIAMTFNNFVKGVMLQLILVYIISGFPALKFGIK